MKQKNTAIGKAFLCGSAAMLLLAGCVKESAINEKYRPAGTPITFSAATGYENGTGTRTEYSGQLYDGTQRYERIDWVANDPVTIVYAQGTGTPTTSQYIVTDVSGDTDRNSYASVEVAEGQTKLTWGDGERVHKFYAMYPSKGFKDNDDADLTNNGTHVKGFIPHIQTVHLSADGTKYLPAMEYGYMVAYKEIAANSPESRVTLPFTPAVTAFEFKLQRAADEEDLKVTAITLSSVADSESDQTPLHGDFEFDITGGNENGATWGTVTTSRVEYSLDIRINGEGGIGPLSIPAHDSGTYLDFTFFALPVEQTNLQLRLNFENGTSKTLKLNNQDGTPHVFAAAKKHIITNTNVPGAGDWTYVITGLEDCELTYLGGEGSVGTAVQSYRQRGSVMEAVPFHLEFSEDGTNWTTTAPEWISFATTTYSGSTTGQSVHLTMGAQIGVQEPTEHTLELRSRTVVSDVDLSTINVATGATVSRSTANCYVVQAPGTYKFPLVYGNAIKNGETNESSYVRQGTGQPNAGLTVLDRMLDHRGSGITSPYIRTQLSELVGQDWHAQLLWMDEPDLIQDVALDATGDYITFTVPATTIHQGNALLALFVDDTIVWSWHIWVTDEDMTVLYPGSNGYEIAPVNIGWCDADNDKTFAERAWKVRAVQDSGTNMMTSIKQIRQTEAVFHYYPNNPYFQWGRKDPIQAGKGKNDEGAKPYYPSSDSNPFYPANGEGPNTVDYGIRNPHKLIPGARFGTSRLRQWIRDNIVCNLWNVEAVQGQDNYDRVFKSIYDPSPCGYMVPNVLSFNDFTSSQFAFIPDAMGNNTSLCHYLRDDGLTLPCVGNGGGSRLDPDGFGTRYGRTAYHCNHVGYNAQDNGFGNLTLNFPAFNFTKIMESAFSLSVRPVKEYRPE